jgi:hypothetical protein
MTCLDAAHRILQQAGEPLHQQPIGWEPDRNDGVRLNIRPFVTAGVLRHKFIIHWKKDRGRNPDGSERFNDLHSTRAEKLAARTKHQSQKMIVLSIISNPGL